MTQYEYYGSKGDGAGSVPDLTNTHEIINGHLVPKSTTVLPERQPSYEPRIDTAPSERRSRRGLGKAAITLVLAGGMLYGGSQFGANAAHWTHDNVPWVSDAIGFVQQMTGNK